MTLAVDEPRIQELVGSLNRKMMINGEWVNAASGRTFDSVNPATEEVLASVAHGEAEDVNRAVRAARTAFQDGAPWRKMPHGQRGRIMHKLGDLILEHLEEFAMLDSLDNGKPYTVAKAADVPLAADMFQLHVRMGDED
jgi:phenylacetaldehyde dehydrogenase